MFYVLLIFPSECSEDIIARRTKDKEINYVLKYGLLMDQSDLIVIKCIRMENFRQNTSAIVFPFPRKHFLLFNPNL